MAEWMAGKGTTALGIIGTALGGVATLGGGLLGNMGMGMNGARLYEHAPSDDHFVNRYEAAQAARIAELETDVKLRDANTYTDKKMLELYENLAGRINDTNGKLAEQAVINQKTADSFALAHSDLMAVKSELKHDIQIEAERRGCADNCIVNYVNATFYPKQVADVTVGTEMTPQPIYNPIPRNGGCGC